MPYHLVGSAAEATDRFRGVRYLPELQKGDYLAIHDTGAYAGENRYSGRLSAAAYLYQMDGSFACIRRAETPEDFLTLFA